MNIKGEPVTDQVNAILNSIAGPLEKETEQTRSVLSQPVLAAGARRCTWIGKCYYCEIGSGRWQLMFCVSNS